MQGLTKKNTQLSQELEECGLELGLALFKLLGQLRVLLCKTLHSI